MAFIPRAGNEPKPRSKRVYVADIDTQRLVPARSREEERDDNAAIMAAQRGFREKMDLKNVGAAPCGKKVNGEANQQSVKLFSPTDGRTEPSPVKTHFPREYNVEVLEGLHKGGLANPQRDNMAIAMSASPSLMDKEQQDRETLRFYRQSNRSPGPNPMAGKNMLESLTDHDKGARNASKKVQVYGATGDPVSPDKVTVFPGTGGVDKYAAKFETMRALPESPLRKLSSHRPTDPLVQSAAPIGSPTDPLFDKGHRRRSTDFGKTPEPILSHEREPCSSPDMILSAAYKPASHRIVSDSSTMMPPLPSMASPKMQKKVGGGCGFGLREGGGGGGVVNFGGETATDSPRGKKQYQAGYQAYGDDTIEAPPPPAVKQAGVRIVEQVLTEHPHVKMMSSLDWSRGGFR